MFADEGRDAGGADAAGKFTPELRRGGICSSREGALNAPLGRPPGAEPPAPGTPATLATHAPQKRQAAPAAWPSVWQFPQTGIAREKLPAFVT
jgi:hypothetical protein